ncbi:MAG: DNA repair and recombination protein RadB [Candidatus Nanohaloarchaea archaeon]
MKVERLSTGSEPLDELLSGGIERGIITNVFGESGSGKTNLCVQVAAELAEGGEKVVYIDTEKGFSPERFAQVADEESLDNVILAEPFSFEQQEERIESLEEVMEDEEPQPSAVIVDSMVSLYRLKAKGDQVQEFNQRLSQQLSELSRIARKYDIPVMVTNQVYTSFDEDGIELVGRDVPRYWSKCLLKLSSLDNGVRKAEIEKHRSIPEGKAVKFKIANRGLVEADETGLF